MRKPRSRSISNLIRKLKLMKLITESDTGYEADTETIVNKLIL